MENSSIAYRSSLNIKGINKSLTGLARSVRNAKSSTSNIANTLNDSNRDKRKSISLSSSLFRRRREASLRKNREDIIEAGSIGGAIKRSGKVIMSSTKGFLGRILDFLGVVLIGWVVNNLPKIISLAEGMIKRMKQYFSVLNDFVGGVSQTLIGFVELIGGIGTSISTFNFSNIQSIFDKSLLKMQSGLNRMVTATQKSLLMMTKDTSSMLNMMGLDIADFAIPNLFNQEAEASGSGSEPQQQGAGSNQQQGSAGPYPDPKSAEMYRIAAALSTEGSSDQGYADMMQVVANRKAMGFAGGGSYTDILAAGTGGNNVAFAGVWDRPGGPSGFRRIQTLSDASKWSGQSEGTLLKIISLMTDPARQASAASFVGGATEFKGSPQNVKGNPNIAADANGFIPGTVWRGTKFDNQFQVDPSRGDIVRPGGAAPLGNLPKAQPPKEQMNKNKNESQSPPSNTLEYFFRLLQNPEKKQSNISGPQSKNIAYAKRNKVVIINRKETVNVPVAVGGGSGENSIESGLNSDMNSMITMLDQANLNKIV